MKLAGDPHRKEAALIYIISAVAGLVYGALMGGLKYIALWRKIIIAGPNEEITARTIYIRMPIDYGINVMTFVILFLVRNIILPLDFAVTAIAASVSLSLIGRFFSIRKVFDKISAETGAEEKTND